LLSDLIMENSNSATSTTTSAISKTDQMMNRMKISSSTYIAERFPINSLQQITLLPNHEVVTGRVYCTDEMTRTVVLQKALTYTTLSCEIRIIAVNNILNAQQLPEKGTTTSGENGNNKDATDDIDTVRATPLMQPLPIIQKKVLEERERRAIRLAEESLRHINPKV
jgi:protein LSM12